MSEHIDIFERCCAVEREAFESQTPAITIDCYPYYRHAQEDYPYFTHRLAPSQYVFDTEWVQDELVIVQIVMIVGARTEGYRNEDAREVETRLYTYMEIVRAAFTCQFRAIGKPGGAYLSSSNADFGDFTSPPSYIKELGARLISHEGYREIDQSNIGVLQVGTVFNLEVPIYRDFGGI